MTPTAYINVEKRTLEFAMPMAWHTPTVANLDRIPLFTKEALAQAAQEPVADDFFRTIADRNPKPFPPPQRTWVGLEGEEIRNLWEEATKPDRSTMTMVTSFARTIEAKLKEKNNA